MSPPNAERRSERARQEILRAALELCREVGFAKLTVEAIARRAGAGKQTIYRWWPSKAAVVLEALNESVGDATDFPDTGDVVADLTQQMSGVVGLLTSQDFKVPYTGIIAAGQSDPEVARALVDMIMMPRVLACRKRLERAQESGELRANVDLDDVVELLYAPLYYRMLLQTRPMSVAQVQTVLALAFDGLRPTGDRGQ